MRNSRCSVIHCFPLPNESEKLVCRGYQRLHPSVFDNVRLRWIHCWLIRISNTVAYDRAYKTAHTVGAAASCYWIMAVGEQAVFLCSQLLPGKLCFPSGASAVKQIQQGLQARLLTPTRHRCLGTGKGTCMSFLARCTTPISCKLAWEAENAFASEDPACKLHVPSIRQEQQLHGLFPQPTGAHGPCTLSLTVIYRHTPTPEGGSNIFII